MFLPVPPVPDVSLGHPDRVLDAPFTVPALDAGSARRPMSVVDQEHEHHNGEHQFFQHDLITG